MLLFVLVRAVFAIIIIFVFMSVFSQIFSHVGKQLENNPLPEMPNINALFAPAPQYVDGNKILENIATQMSFGARYVGSEGHERAVDFFVTELKKYAPEVETQKWGAVDSQNQKQNLTNIIARFYPEKKDRIIISTHYDSKKTANLDPANQTLPVPGANDSASGVAIIIEMARYLSTVEKEPNIGIDFVLFDGEEQETDSNGWNPLGSTYFVNNLKTFYPDKDPVLEINIDMVCDKDLNIFKEVNSYERYPDPANAIWDLARKRLAFGFRQSKGQGIFDDHTPFYRANIPAVLIVDFDYKYWHTTADTIDKCGKGSVEEVGNVLLDYIYSR